MRPALYDPTVRNSACAPLKFGFLDEWGSFRLSKVSAVWHLIAKSKRAPLTGVYQSRHLSEVTIKTPPATVGPQGVYSITPRSARLVKSDSVMIRWS